MPLYPYYSNGTTKFRFVDQRTHESNVAKAQALNAKLKKAAYIVATVFGIIVIAHVSHAETYVINGSKGKTKLEAIVAMAQSKTAKVERCKFTEKTDSNDGSVVCHAVELSNRGTLRLQK